MTRRPSRARRQLVAWDSWAFLEVAFERPRNLDVAALMGEADGAITSREVVAETFNHIVNKTKSTATATAWWASLEEGDVRVLEASMDDIRDFAHPLAERGTLSFTDLALGCVARREGVTLAATEDGEFRRMGLQPLFAK